MTYFKPLFAPVHSDRESAGCCFYFDNAGNQVYYYPSSGNPGPGTYATVNDKGASITLICGSTGTFLTQPQTFGIPAGTSGVNAAVSNDGCGTAAVGPSLGVSAGGAQVLQVPLPTGVTPVQFCARLPTCSGTPVCTG